MASDLTSFELQSTSDLSSAARLIRGAAYALSLVLMFVIPIEGVVQIEGVGRLSRVVGLLAAGVWALSVVATGQIRKPRAFHLFLGLFVLWNALSVFWTIDLDRTMERIQTWGQLGFMVLILWDLYDTPQALYVGLQAFVLGAFASALGVIYNYVSNASFYTGRFAAAGLHVDDIGIMLALSIPVAWHLAMSTSARETLSPLWRILNFAFPAIAMTGICLTGTRAALVASLPALLFMVISILRFSPSARIGSFVLMVGATIVVIAAVPRDSIERLSTIGEEVAQGDLNGRFTIWREGLMVFTERPVLGTGAYAYRTATPSGMAAHNSLLSVMVELGLVGLGLFLACLLLSLFAAVSLPKWEAWFCLTWLTVWLLGVSTLTWEHRKPTWIVLSFVVALAAAHMARKPDEVYLNNGQFDESQFGEDGVS